jgi:hydrogenase nickel incorporation protein HypB
MCGTCGCGSSEMTLTNLETGQRIALESRIEEHEHVHADGTRHSHSHSHEHEDDHHHHEDGHRHHADDHDHHAPVSVIDLNTRILAKNDAAAARNHAWLRGREILAINLMSAPGAGKTTLLERTVAALKAQQTLFVLEGDQATAHDGERVRAAGAAAVQINTGTGCHLDAEMVARGIDALKPPVGALLFIENVGNLVCPALFDLGEAKRVAILSVAEGDDKPVKYPHMFRAADLLLVNKTDLLEHVDFNMDRAIAYAREVNPNVEILKVSARTGDGMAAWLDWIAKAHRQIGIGAFA